MSDQGRASLRPRSEPSFVHAACSKLKRVTVPFFSGADVERAVSPHEAYDAVKAAFIAHAKGTWTMQPKVYVSGSEHGDFRAMPALGDGHAVLKWVTSFPGNPPKGLPTVSGLVLLSDTETGALLALMDAAAVTALRTAAAAVIAAETLCRAGAESTAVIGCGVNGAETARMFRALGGDVQLWDVDAARAAFVADRLGATVAPSQQDALASDIVVTVTPGQELLYPSGSLRDGQHVSMMGADGPGQGRGRGRRARPRRPVLRRLGAGEPRRRARRRCRGGCRHPRSRHRHRTRARRRCRGPPQRSRHHAVRLHGARDPGSRDRQSCGRQGRPARPAAPRSLSRG